MAFHIFIKATRDNFAIHIPTHVSDFFRSFINQQDNQFDVGVIGRDTVADVLQHHGFTGSRRRDNEATLTSAHRR